MRNTIRMLVFTTFIGLLAPAAPAGEAPAAAPFAAGLPQEKPKKKKRWVPGHYEWRTVRVKVPARTKRVWRPPVYRTAHDGAGNPIQVLVRPGRFETIRIPATVKTERRRVWVKGRYLRTR